MIGPHNWGIEHYGGLIATPLLIYGVRKGITAVFGWQISRQQSHLSRLQKQREEKIADLKKATRYDSTQELLQKYGGAPPKPIEDEQNKEKKRNTKEQKPQPYVQRTGIAPPPTANIVGRNRATTSPSDGLQPRVISSMSPMLSHQTLQHSPVEIEEPGFAPNAFSQPPPPSRSSTSSRSFSEHRTHWYDRILDVMLGEDETLAKNRMVLLCQNCRLINGQAPPGVKTLEELGRWRCQSCGAWNGTQSEVSKVVQEMTKKNQDISPVTPSKVDHLEERDATEKEEETIQDQEGATGAEHSPESDTVTKRVTRSAGKAELDGI